MELVQGELTHQKRPRIVESIALLALISVDIFSGSTALTGPKKVRGVVGESVTVECRYDQKYKDYVKKWCRGETYVGCNDLVSTEQPQKGQVSMTDNKIQGIFSVTMDNLKMSDEGLYQCMIEREMWKPNKRLTISLEVSEGTQRKIHHFWALTRWIVFGVLVLCTVSILCMTAVQRQVNEKVHEKQNLRLRQISPSRYNRNNLELSALKTRELYIDFRSNGSPLHTLIINNSTVGTASSFKYLLISISLKMKISLAAAHHYCRTCSTALTGPKKVRGVVGESVTVECRYDQKYKDYVKKWCRGETYTSCSAVVSTEQPQSERITMTDYKTQGILSVTMDNLKMSDEGLYQCMIERAMLIPNERFTISLEISEAPEKKATTLEISTETMWTTSPQNEMSTRKAESTESSVSSHQIRPTPLSQWHIILAIALSVLFLLLITAMIICAKLRQKMKTGNASGVCQCEASQRRRGKHVHESSGSRCSWKSQNTTCLRNCDIFSSCSLIIINSSSKEHLENIANTFLCVFLCFSAAVSHKPSTMTAFCGAVLDWCRGKPLAATLVFIPPRP
ncbi:polymeric immunoglobulin receptor-like [Mobula hypostoma]|uniref:polymeric immunoglobulin receptor-like n=1 Tax=Mobula hypostoma TaxID=723540 RepID=UPI002FC297D3